MPNRRDILKQLGGTVGGALAWGTLGGVARAGGAAGSRIKVGQIGTGHAHAAKLSVFRQSDDYEVVGIVEPDARPRSRDPLRYPG